MSSARRFVRYVVGNVQKEIAIADTLPTRLPTGRWASPKISKLQLARARKEAAPTATKPWYFDKPAVNHPVVFKGQKHMVTQKKRFDLINEKMKDMPAKIEEYRKNLISRRVHSLDPRYVVNHGWGRMK